MKPENINPFQAMDGSGYPSKSGEDWYYGFHLPKEYRKKYKEWKQKALAEKQRLLDAATTDEQRALIRQDIAEINRQG